MMKIRMGKFLSAAAIILAGAPQAYAATTDTVVHGTQSNSIQTCLQALTNAVGEGEDCGYGLTANNQGLPFGEIIGPLTQGGFYSDTNAPFPFTNGNGVPTDGATGYTRGVGDDKIEPLIDGTISVDDAGTPGDGSDDLISFDLTWTDPLGGKIIRHLGTAVVEKYTSMHQVLTPWPVDSATANGAGGYDYVIGSLGFPGRIRFLDGDGAGGDGDFTACDGQLFGSVECSPSFGAGVVNNQKYDPAAGANWVAHQAAVGLGTLEGNHGAQTTGTVADIECVDASDGPLGDDVDQAGSPAAASDCDDSKIAFSAALIGDCVNFPDAPTATTGCNQIDMDVNFDNLLLKVSTNAVGTVISAEGFDVQETIVFGATDECGDMTVQNDGSGPGGAVGPGLQPFCNTWLSGYFTLASPGVEGHFAAANNASGVPLAARLRPSTGGALAVERVNTTTGAALTNVNYLAAGGFSGRQVVGLTNIGATAAEELAVLATRDSDGQIRAEIRDAGSRALLKSFTLLSGAYLPVWLFEVPDLDGNGKVDVGLLAMRKSDGRTLVKLAGSLSGATIGSIIYYSPGLVPIMAEALPDLDGSGQPEVAVLAEKPATDRYQVQIRNALGAAAVRNVTFAAGADPLQLIIGPDKDNNAVPELAVLARQRSDGRALVEMRNAFGAAAVKRVFYSPGYAPVAFAQAGDTDSNTVPEWALLLDRNSDHRPYTQLRNQTGTAGTVSRAYLTTAYRAQQIVVLSDSDGIGGPDIGVIAQRSSDGRLRMEIRNARGGGTTRAFFFSP